MNKFKVCLDNYLVEIDNVIAKGKYKDNWESLADYPVPKWYKDAKFGIFSHFGLYTIPEKNSEWYSRNMYVQGSSSFNFHIEKYGVHKEFGYRNFIELFKADKFKASEWLDLVAKSGAKYYIPVAEHHDGFQMYQSNLSDFNSLEMGPKIDFIKELQRESIKRDIEFCVSSHRAEHYWFMEGALDFDSDIVNPKYGDIYWPTIREKDLNKDVETTKLFMEDWLVRCCELVDKFSPKIVYFDWWIETPIMKPYILKFAAYYYNKMDEMGECGIINYKHDGYMYSSAVRDMERGQFSQIQPDYWQCCTSLSTGSWSYTKENNYKTTEELIQTLVDVISKNGNLLLNMGPKANGELVPIEVEILGNIGKWLEDNGSAIYGSKVWKVFGEGPTNTSGGDFSEGKAARYTDEDFRFTRRADKLYVIAMKPLENETIKVRSLKVSKGILKTHGVIKDIKLLGSGNINKWVRNKYSLDIKYEAESYELPLVFELTMG